MQTQKANTKCAICGKDYYVCVSCKSHNLTPWKIHTDTAEHYQVFQILRGVSLGVYTKSEAKEKLDSLNLKDVDTYIPSVQKRVKDIVGEVGEVVEPVDDVDVEKDELDSDKPELLEKEFRVKGRKTNRKKS